MEGKLEVIDPIFMAEFWKFHNAKPAPSKYLPWITVKVNKDWPINEFCAFFTKKIYFKIVAKVWQKYCTFAFGLTS